MVARMSLQACWNGCVVLAAWFCANPCVAQEVLTNGDFETGNLTGWQTYVYDPANSVSVASEATHPHALKMDMVSTAAGPVEWYLQTYQTSAALDALQGEGFYTLRYRARATVPRTVVVQLLARSPFQVLGLNSTSQLGSLWQDFAVHFRTPPVMPASGVTLVFYTGHAAGTVFLDDISLKPASVTTYSGNPLVLAGFEPGEAWSAGTYTGAHVHEGSAGLMLDAPVDGAAYAERNLPMDLSGDWEISMWVYTDTPDHVARFALAFRSGDISQDAFTFFSTSGLVAGWNHLRIPRGRFYSFPWYPAFSWSGAWMIGIKLEANGNGAAQVVVDDLRVEPIQTGDHLPPIISWVNTFPVSASSATVTWTTSEPATGVLRCGTSTAYSVQAEHQDLRTSHELQLSNLLPATRYHCRLSSTDSAQLSGQSGDFTFRTDPPMPRVPPDAQAGFKLGLFEVYGMEALSRAERSRFSDFSTYEFAFCPDNPVAVRAYLDELAAHGHQTIMMFCRDMIESGDLAGIRAKVRAYRNHPAVAGWYLVDEPEGFQLSPQRLHDAYLAVREEDLSRPVMLASYTLSPTYTYLGSFDYALVDSYPVPYFPASHVLDLLTSSQASGARFGFVFQGYQTELHHWLGSNRIPGRNPSRAEMREMAYLALNHGAQDLWVYSYNYMNAVPGFEAAWANLHEVVNELMELRPLWSSREPTAVSATGPPSLDVGVRTLQGVPYIVAVNTSAAPVSATLSLTGVGNWVSTTEVTEARDLGVSAQQITDTWPPHGGWVYRLQATSPPGSSSSVMSSTSTSASGSSPSGASSLGPSTSLSAGPSTSLTPATSLASPSSGTSPSGPASQSGGGGEGDPRPACACAAPLRPASRSAAWAMLLGWWLASRLSRGRG